MVSEYDVLVLNLLNSTTVLKIKFEGEMQEKYLESKHKFGSTYLCLFFHKGNVPTKAEDLPIATHECY